MRVISLFTLFADKSLTFLRVLDLVQQVTVILPSKKKSALASPRRGMFTKVEMEEINDANCSMGCVERI